APMPIVRCFTDPDVVHVGGGVNPLRDVETIETELMLADVETLDRRKQRVEKKVRSGDPKAAKELAVVEKLGDLLNKGEWLGNQPFTAEERAILTECQLLSAKPILFIANAAEGAGEDDPLVRPVKELADKRKARLVILYGQLEAERSTLPAEDRGEVMTAAGPTDSAQGAPPTTDC